LVKQTGSTDALFIDQDNLGAELEAKDELIRKYKEENARLLASASGSNAVPA